MPKIFAWSVVLGLLPIHTLAAQRVVVAGPARCDSCRITVSRELLFGDDSGSGIIEDLGSWVRRGPHGEYLVVARAGSAQTIAVFDSLGRFRQRVGRPGQGPREFQDIVQVQVVHGTHIAVLDRLNMRLSLWSAQFALEETHPLGVLLGNDAFYLPDGSLISNGRQPTPALVGRPAILIDTAGQPIRAFNAHGDRYVATNEDQSRRRLALSGDTAFWSAHVDRYEMHLWRPGGQLLLTLDGSLDWFPNVAEEQIPGEPSPPRLLDLREKDGVLWMLVAVADKDWKDSVTPDAKNSRGYHIVDYRGYRDAMLHAVDVHSGELLGEYRLDVPAFNFVDDDHLAYVEEDADLVPRMVIVAFHLLR